MVSDDDEKQIELMPLTGGGGGSGSDDDNDMHEPKRHSKYKGLQQPPRRRYRLATRRQVRTVQTAFLVFAVLTLLALSYVAIACGVFFCTGPVKASRDVLCYAHKNRTLFAPTLLGPSFVAMEEWAARQNLTDAVAHERNSDASFMVVNDGSVCPVHGKLTFHFSRGKNWLDHVVPLWLVPGLDNLRTIRPNDACYSAITERAALDSMVESIKNKLNFIYRVSTVQAAV